MNTMPAPWFAFGEPFAYTLRCAACTTDIDLEGPQADHPRLCPACGIECAFLNWKMRVLQVVPANAPPPVRKVLAFAQDRLGELEYVELLVSRHELIDQLYAADPLAARPA